MNKIKTLLLAAALIGGGLLTSQAQTITNSTGFLAGFPGLGSATNISAWPYMTYAPKAPTKIGGGVLAVWDVNNYVGIGGGVDWLGNFSLVSGDVTLQAPYNLGALPIVGSKLNGIYATPFVIVGIGTPIGGSGNNNGGISTVSDVGAEVSFGHFLGGKFGVGGCYGKWTGVGPYDVPRYHIFAGWEKGL